MDLLRKYDGLILCAKRAIHFTREDGTTVEFMEAISANQSSVLNQVKGTSLDEIRIVQEFLYVFLEELPGMQPHRDIEFIIELLPGTPPISSPFLTTPSSLLAASGHPASPCFSVEMPSPSLFSPALISLPKPPP
jgi:hypothetical protein